MAVLLVVFGAVRVEGSAEAKCYSKLANSDCWMFSSTLTAQFHFLSYSE